MSAMASQIIGVSMVYSTVCSGDDQRKHQSSMFPYDDVIMESSWCNFVVTAMLSLYWNPITSDDTHPPCVRFWELFTQYIYNPLLHHLFINDKFTFFVKKTICTSVRPKIRKQIIYIYIIKTCFKMTGLNHLECKAVIWGDVYPPWWSWWHKVVMPNQGCDLKPSFTNQIAKMCKNIVLWSTRPTDFSIIMWIIGGHKFLFSTLITVGFNADLVTH